MVTMLIAGCKQAWTWANYTRSGPVATTGLSLRGARLLLAVGTGALRHSGCGNGGEAVQLVSAFQPVVRQKTEAAGGRLPLRHVRLTLQPARGPRGCQSDRLCQGLPQALTDARAFDTAHPYR